MIKRNKRIPIPEYDGEFVHIYSPGGDTYEGEDTVNYKHGNYYGEWITNDFSIIKDDGGYRMIGITHPRPAGFIDDYNYDEADVHEAEYQCYHCFAKGEHFKDVFYENSFKDFKKILYPSARKGEQPELWAPHFMKENGEYKVIYSPRKMRLAISRDMENFTVGKCFFECNSPVARDPYVFVEDGKYYLIYTENKQLKYRVSSDFENWSEEKVLQDTLFANGENESPFMFKRDGIYYLLWSVCDGRCGCYDSRTFVFAAEKFEDFMNAAPITMLRAHAPEVVCDGDDYYLLSTFYPHNGVSAVKLKWDLNG